MSLGSSSLPLRLISFLPAPSFLFSFHKSQYITDRITFCRLVTTARGPDGLSASTLTSPHLQAVEKTAERGQMMTLWARNFSFWQKMVTSEYSPDC